MSEHRITVHAAHQWLARIELVDVDAVRRKMAAVDERSPASYLELDVVNWALAETGRTLDMLESEIVTPGVLRALALQCEFAVVHPKGARLVCKGGKVVTVTRAGERRRLPNDHRLKKLAKKIKRQKKAQQS